VRRTSYDNKNNTVGNNASTTRQQEEQSEILQSTDSTDPTDLPKRNVPAIPNDEDDLQQRQGLGSDRSERSVVSTVTATAVHNMCPKG
jgi:hypothetical protein